jgi:hypothetical protein
MRQSRKEAADLLFRFLVAFGRYPLFFVVMRDICGIGMSGGTVTTLRS